MHCDEYNSVVQNYIEIEFFKRIFDILLACIFHYKNVILLNYFTYRQKHNFCNSFYPNIFKIVFP